MFRALFGCTHRHHSWPLSKLNRRTVSPYVVCLDCGKEFAYDWRAMRIAERITARPEARPVVVRSEA